MIGVIGAVRGDILGNPYGQVAMEQHNPGTLSMVFAGTGMNLCRNLKALEEEVKFFSVAGDDLPGNAAKVELSNMGVDVSKFLLMGNCNTSMSLEIRNIVDDLELSFGNSDVLEKMDGQFLRDCLADWKEADLLISDASCSPEGWRVLLEEKGDVPLFVDPDGVEEERISPADLKYVHTLLPSRREAEKISGMDILSEEQLKAAGQWFVDQGLQRIFITLSGGGVYCREGSEEHILRPEVGTIVDTKGAGDAFATGVAAAFLQKKSLEETGKYAMATASLTLEAGGYINEELSREKVERRLK